MYSSMFNNTKIPIVMYIAAHSSIAQGEYLQKRFQMSELIQCKIYVTARSYQWCSGVILMIFHSKIL